MSGNMRKAMASTILEKMRKNEDIYLLFGDLGYGQFDDIREEFPERAINCGVAEQNMIGVAAGLAHEGKLPIVYSIAPFVSTRVHEQIKLDLCYSNLDCIIIAAGSSCGYGHLGYSHYCFEDVGIFSNLDHCSVVIPTTDYTAQVKIKSCISSFSKNKSFGLKYFRLTHSGFDYAHERLDNPIRFPFFVDGSDDKIRTMILMPGSVFRYTYNLEQIFRDNFELFWYEDSEDIRSFCYHFRKVHSRKNLRILFFDDTNGDWTKIFHEATTHGGKIMSNMDTRCKKFCFNSVNTKDFKVVRSYEDVVHELLYGRQKAHNLIDFNEENVRQILDGCSLFAGKDYKIEKNDEE